MPAGEVEAQEGDRAKWQMSQGVPHIQKQKRGVSSYINKSAPIGAWKCNFHALLENYDKQTDRTTKRTTNLPTDGHEGPVEVILAKRVP